MTEKYFWVVLRKNDSMLKRHGDPDSAVKEAIRLAEKEKDAFFILKTVDCYAPTRVESIPLVHEDATGDTITPCDERCIGCGKKFDPNEITYFYARSNYFGKQCANCFELEYKNNCSVYKNNECFGCIGPSEGLDCNTCQSDMKERDRR